jgi:GxxExxY protein
VGLATDDEVLALCDVIRKTCLDIHGFLRHGHLEKVYENALGHRLAKRGLQVQQQYPVPVKDEDGTLLGDFVADLRVEGVIIIEIKAAKALADEHVAQLLGYLRATQMRHGMLVNFGAPRLELRKLVL